MRRLARGAEHRRLCPDGTLAAATMRILIADDTEIVRMYLAEAVAAQGWQSERVADGELALARAVAARFDLLLLDVRMPGLFGDLVLARLRARPDACSRTAPAIALSSEMDPETAATLRAAGFAAALGKPVPGAQLVATMRQILGLTPLVAAAPAAPLAALAGLPLLDDQRALQALGKPALVESLRALFSRELELREAEFQTASAAGQVARMRELIHQLLASCALCGATRLEASLKALRAALLTGDAGESQRALAQFEAAAAELRAVLPAR